MVNEILRILKGDFGVFCVHIINEMNYWQKVLKK